MDEIAKIFIGKFIEKGIEMFGNSKRGSEKLAVIEKKYEYNILDLYDKIELSKNEYIETKKYCNIIEIIKKNSHYNKILVVGKKGEGKTATCFSMANEMSKNGKVFYVESPNETEIIDLLELIKNKENNNIIIDNLLPEDIDDLTETYMENLKKFIKNVQCTNVIANINSDIFEKIKKIECKCIDFTNKGFKVVNMENWYNREERKIIIKTLADKYIRKQDDFFKKLSQEEKNKCINHENFSIGLIKTFINSENRKEKNLSSFLDDKLSYGEKIFKLLSSGERLCLEVIYSLSDQVLFKSDLIEVYNSCLENSKEIQNSSFDKIYKGIEKFILTEKCHLDNEEDEIIYIKNNAIKKCIKENITYSEEKYIVKSAKYVEQIMKFFDSNNREGRKELFRLMSELDEDNEILIFKKEFLPFASVYKKHGDILMINKGNLNYLDIYHKLVNDKSCDFLNKIDKNILNKHKEKVRELVKWIIGKKSIIACLNMEIIYSLFVIEDEKAKVFENAEINDILTASVINFTNDEVLNLYRYCNIYMKDNEECMEKIRKILPKYFIEKINYFLGDVIEDSIDAFVDYEIEDIVESLKDAKVNSDNFETEIYENEYEIDEIERIVDEVYDYMIDTDLKNAYNKAYKLFEKELTTNTKIEKIVSYNIENCDDYEFTAKHEEIKPEIKEKLFDKIKNLI